MLRGRSKFLYSFDIFPVHMKLNINIFRFSGWCTGRNYSDKLILAFLFSCWRKTARGKKYLPMLPHLFGIQSWHLENKA